MQVKTWDKVNEGMVKMYKAEVLAKLPVAQHIFFGVLLPFPDTPIDTSNHDNTVHVDNHGHLHVQGEGFGDCCGIPIPSAFAAAKEEQHKRAGVPPMSSNVRIIPFD
jgi:serine/threonine-protein phosphatase 2A activator